MPEELEFSMLDRDARARLRSLTKENAEFVGLHLIAAAMSLEADPELSYAHAQAALRRGGRVDIVREAVGLAAYRTERYAEALRELRTVRRLNGSSEHLAIMVDCERGLGRPERAVTLAASDEASTLTTEQSIELAIVLAGARADLGEFEAAIAALDEVTPQARERELVVRLTQARIGILELGGQQAEAAALSSTLEPAELDGPTADFGDVVVYEIEDDAPEDDVHEGSVESESESDDATESMEPDVSDEADASDDGAVVHEARHRAASAAPADGDAGSQEVATDD